MCKEFGVGNNLTMATHVTKKCIRNSALCHLHNITCLKRGISGDPHRYVFMTSKLDYCDGLSYGLPRT